MRKAFFDENQIHFSYINKIQKKHWNNSFFEAENKIRLFFRLKKRFHNYAEQFNLFSIYKTLNKSPFDPTNDNIQLFP